MPSPCIGCDFEFEDKNADRCANCRDRIEYCVNIGALPKIALERFDMEQQEKEPEHQRKQGKPPLVDLDALRSMMDAGKPVKDIAEHFGVSGPSIRYHTKRLGYAPRSSRIPKGAIAKSEMEEKERESEAEIAETILALDMADLKAEESSEKKRGRPKQVEKAVRAPRIQVNFHFPHDMSTEAKELMDEVKVIAKQEFRYTNQQILLFIKQGIDKWKNEHEHP